MMKGRLPITVFFTVLVGLASATSVALAGSEQDAAETGRLLAILLDSGRVTVGANQALINDAEKGDKGFTPEAFEKQLVEKFKERSGVDLTNLKTANVPEMAKKLLPQQVEASKQTVAENQSIINKKGVGFKGFIPATFGTQAAAKFSINTDYHEVVTFLALGAITGGEVKVKHSLPHHFDLMTRAFQKLGVTIEHKGDTALVRRHQSLQIETPFTSNLLP